MARIFKTIILRLWSRFGDLSHEMCVRTKQKGPTRMKILILYFFVFSAELLPTKKVWDFLVNKNCMEIPIRIDFAYLKDSFRNHHFCCRCRRRQKKSSAKYKSTQMIEHCIAMHRNYLSSGIGLIQAAYR